MKRIFFAIAVLVVLPLASRAEETVIRLSVQPMAAPKPALRYLLLPDLKEMTPGNPIPNYLKCLLDQDFTAEREVLGKSALRQADRAARMDKPDWQILLKLRTDGIGLLLPDLQKMRMLSNEFKNRFHDEAVRGHFDDALYTARTMFALSRHMGEHPTLIGDLVAIAMATVAIGPLEEMLEQPGCPNLYWALTNLPDPLISVSKGMEGERMLIRSEFPELDDREPMTPGQIKKLIFHIAALSKQGGNTIRGEVNGLRAWINKRTQDEKLVEAARRRLVEYGIAEERIMRFPADQVILLDGYREYEVRRDEDMKLMNLSTWQVEELVHQGKPPKEPALFDEVLPALRKVRRAQGRLEQRIALLRHVEALRLYAAAHDGKLPEKLSDIAVPLPVDPFTGKPFVYKVEGETAHLRGTPPRGEEKTTGYNIHYEITIRK
ncbi:MAG TPA: hypothetical protein VH575_06445 [Gemmataceae bacterium]|jgi:hypothetical protein